MKNDDATHLRFPVWEQKAKEVWSRGIVHAIHVPEIIALLSGEYRAGQEIEKEMQKAKRDPMSRRNWCRESDATKDYS